MVSSYRQVSCYCTVLETIDLLILSFINTSVRNTRVTFILVYIFMLVHPEALCIVLFSRKTTYSYRILPLNWIYTVIQCSSMFVCHAVILRDVYLNVMLLSMT